MTNASQRARLGLGRQVLQSRFGAFLLTVVEVESTTIDGIAVSTAFRMLSVAAWMMLSLTSSCAVLYCGAANSKMDSTARIGLCRILLNTFLSSAFYLVDDVHYMLQLAFVVEAE